MTFSIQGRLLRPARTLLLLSCAVTAGHAAAVPPLPDALPPAPASRFSPDPARPMPAPVVAGRVTRMLINPYGEVDGLLLDERLVVKFPPHLSRRLTDAVAPQQQVRIFGIAETPQVIRADAIVNAATGQGVVDVPPALDSDAPLPPHLRAAQLSQLSVRGKISLVLTGPRGEANGVLLDDGSIVRFAPDSLPFRPDPGMPFAASGMGTRNSYGTAIEAVSAGVGSTELQPLYGRMR